MTTASLTHHLAEGARNEHHLPHSMEYVLRRGVEDHRFFTRFWFDWDPHPGQLAWGAQRAKRAFLVTGARSGKTEGEGARRWRRMFYRPNTIHANVSITQQQARLVHDKMAMLAERPRFQPFVKGVRQSPFPEFELTNRARHTCRSTQLGAKYVRGEKFHELNGDEISYEKKAVWDEVLTMRVADSDGLLSGTTTPRGKNWLFYECGRARAIMKSQLERGVPVSRLESFFRHGPSYENPHFPKRALKRLRRLSERAKAQEIRGLFVELEHQMFTDGQVEKILEPDLNILDTKGGLAPAEPDARHIYCMGIDFARHRHKTVVILGRIDCRPWRIFQVHTWYRIPWEKQIADILELMNRWRANLRYDSNGIGDPVGEWMGLLPERYGLKGQGVTADQLLVRLQEAGTRNPPLFQTLFDPDLDFDLRHYTWDAGEEENEDGDIVHWDHLKALAYFVFEAQRVNPDQAPIQTGGTRETAGLFGRASRRLVHSARDF